jgi:hypothetical protein
MYMYRTVRQGMAIRRMVKALAGILMMVIEITISMLAVLTMMILRGEVHIKRMIEGEIMMIMIVIEIITTM